MRKLLPWLGLALFLLVCALLFESPLHMGETTQPVVLPGPLQKLAQVAPPDVDSVGLPTLAEEKSALVAGKELEAQRVEANKGVLGGVVRSTSGKSIEDALVSWTPMTLTHGSSPTPLVGPLEVLEASLVTRTQNDGRFELPVEALAEAGVIWVSADGFMPEWAAITGNDTSAVVLVLSESPGQIVRVTRESGESSKGAVVLQRGSSGGKLRSGGLNDEDVALLLYARQAVVGGDGTAVLPAWGGRRLYTARLGALRSVVGVSNESLHPVELVLEESIAFSGSVSVEGEGVSTEGAMLFCFMTNSESSRQRFGFTIPLRESGKVEGMRIPWNPKETYQLVVEGEGLVRTEKGFGPFPAGGELIFDLACQQAGEVELHFFEQVEGPGNVDERANVSGVTVTPIWFDVPLESFQSPIQSVLSDSDGWATVANFPKGFLSFRYSAPGYVMGLTPQLNLVGPELGQFEVEMRRSGRVKIKVTDRNEAVAGNYRVLYWGEAQRASEAMVVRLEAGSDGYAFLEDLPLGKLQLIAAVDGRPQTMPAYIEVVHDEDRDVELKIAEQVTGYGRVLDAASGRPVTEALIQISLSAAGDSPGYLNAGLPVEPDGSFSSDLFSPSITMVTVRAPGYSSLPVIGDLGKDGQINYGTLHLGRSQPFAIQCRSANDVDWTQFYGRVSGLIWSPQAPLNADGTYIAEQGQHGPSTFTLTDPEGRQISRSWTLRGTGPWLREVRLGGEASLDVSFEGDPDWAPATLSLSFNSDLDYGDSLSVPIEPGSKSIQFDGIPPGSYALTCYDSMGLSRVCTAVELNAGEIAVLTLSLDLPSLRIRLLEQDGSPIPGAYIWSRDAGHMPNIVSKTVSTNDEGIAVLTATEIEDLVIEAISPTGGYLGPQHILRPKTDEPIDITWSEGELLQVDVFDGKTPLEGLEVWIHRALTSYATVTLDVPMDGHYERSNIAAGAYFAEPHSGWVWFQRVAFELDGKGTPVRLEFRRLGGLTVSVKNLLGNPAAGVVIGLTSDEFGGSVAGWLAEGRVTSDTGLITDAKGEVHLAGLPNGSFSWISGGLAGNVNVAPGTTSALAIQLVE